MAYSRWTNSKWYTFWCAPLKSETLTRDTAIFDVSLVKAFTYKDLKTDIEKCLIEANEISPSTSKELNELKGYMLEFMADVEADLP